MLHYKQIYKNPHALPALWFNEKFLYNFGVNVLGQTMTLVIWDGLLRSISDGAQKKFPTCSPFLRHCDPESSRTLADHYQGWERSLALRIFLVFLEQTQDICGTISILDKIIHIYHINLYLQYQLVLSTIN